MAKSRRKPKDVEGQSPGQKVESATGVVATQPSPSKSNVDGFLAALATKDPTTWEVVIKALLLLALLTGLVWVTLHEVP